MARLCATPLWIFGSGFDFARPIQSGVAQSLATALQKADPHCLTLLRVVAIISVSVLSAELRLWSMFESLSDKLKRTLKNLRGEGVLTKEHVDAALREIRLALLEADVNYKVAKDFIAVG